MKFREWTIDSLIEWLVNLKSSPLLDYKCVTRLSGEITAVNGEKKHEPEPPKEDA